MLGITEFAAEAAKKISETAKGPDIISNNFKDIFGNPIKRPEISSMTGKDVYDINTKAKETSIEKQISSFWEKLEEPEIEKTDLQEGDVEVSTKYDTQEADLSAPKDIHVAEGMGGAYGEVKERVQEAGFEDMEVHHMPADSVSPLERVEGPAIAMEKEDHRLTASCGNSKEAQEYRAMQREKIENGDFSGAMQMDIDDIHDKFGNKYDRQIEEAKVYQEKLMEAGRI